MMRKEIDPAYKPKVKGETDAGNFDPIFTGEVVVDSVVAPSALSTTLSTEGDAFKDFTFAERRGMLSD